MTAKRHTVPCAVAAALLIATIIPKAPAADPPKPAAFPGAEGFAGHVTGGRGKPVYAVTTLADSGPGSLRDAVSEGNRTVVFRVSGTIDARKRIEIKGPNITVAGQTAPGDGICIKGKELFIRDTKNVIVRFLRCRPGDLLGEEHDALTIWNSQDVIVDHCSLSWSTDSVSDVVKGSRNVTIQWCIVSEPLDRSVHAKGSHGYGTGWSYGSYHHNLIAHCASRAPRLAADPTRGLVDVRNNVIYNWGFGWAYGGEHADVDFVNNYFRPGPDSQHNHILFNPWASNCRVYLSGNVLEGNAEVTSDNAKGLVSEGSVWKEPVVLDHVLVPASFGGAAVKTHPAQQAVDLVLAKAGATLPKRDPVDERVVASVRDRGGRLINSQADVGGWPELKSVPPPPDSDADGMPDAWEAQRGLQPGDPDDGPRQAPDHSGYTNLEVYLNELAAAAM